MARIDWSVLSGPRVSRRTLLSLAAASGATGYASRLARRAPRRFPPHQPFSVPGPRENRRPAAPLASASESPDPYPRPGPGQPRDRCRRAGLQLFSSLVQFDEQLGLVPDLAETWTVARTAHYTFTLRYGLTFHNGDPLVADDLVYTYDRTTNPDFASPHANKLALVTRPPRPTI